MLLPFFFRDFPIFLYTIPRYFGVMKVIISHLQTSFSCETSLQPNDALWSKVNSHSKVFLSLVEVQWNSHFEDIPTYGGAIFVKFTL